MNLSGKDIRTERLRIRKLYSTDGQAVFEIFSNLEVTRFWGKPAMKNLSEAQQFIEETHCGFEDGKLMEWGIIETSSNRLIGTCAYAGLDKTHKRAEIGFALHRDWWRQGYMKELLSVFIPFGLNRLGLHRIEADVDPRNLPAIRLLEHFGFKREGYLRERYHMNGELQDSVFYGLLKSEYKSES